MNNKISDLLKDTFIIGFGNLFSKGIIFFLIPLQTSSMSKSEYGIAEMLFNLVNILIPIFTLGIAETGMRFCIGDDERRSKVFLIVTVIPLIGGFILALISVPFLVVNNEYMRYFSSMFMLYLFFSLKDIYLQYSKGIGNLKLFSLGSVLFSCLLISFSYYFLIIDQRGVQGYLNAYILSNLLTVVYLLSIGGLKRYFEFSYKKIDKLLLITMLTYSIPLISNLLAWWITNLSNRYVLAYYNTLEDVGIYSALVKFSLILTTVFGVFFQSWQINAAKNINMHGRSEFFSKIHNYFLVAVIVSSSLFLTTSNIIASFFIRGNFFEATMYLPGIILTGTVSCLPMYWGAIYGAIKNTKGAFYSTLFGSVGSVIFNFLLIPKYGIYGAITSTLISYLMVTGYRIVELNRIIQIELYLVKHLFGLSVLAVQALGLSYFSATEQIVFFNSFALIALFMIYRKSFLHFAIFIRHRVKIV